MNTEKQDVYNRITGQILASLEQGVRPWTRPWNAEHAAGRITRPLRHNGQPYSGINILMLWASASGQGFTAPIWMTFNQALELKAYVRKGERGSLVVYANRITKTEHDVDGNDIEREIPFMKGYTVFNVEQIDGLPEHYYAKAVSKLTPVERIAHAERFFAGTGAEIRYGGNRAYYSQDGDRIQMPPVEAFRDAESFYSTLAHETAHNADSGIMPRRTLDTEESKGSPTRLLGITLESLQESEQRVIRSEPPGLGLRSCDPRQSFLL
jgi:antirestriction protein ArdC